MTTAPNLEDLRRMPMSERLRLMEDLWASFAERPDVLEAPAWHLEELDARLKTHRANSDSTLDWSDVKAELTKSPRK